MHAGLSENDRLGSKLSRKELMARTLSLGIEDKECRNMGRHHIAGRIPSDFTLHLLINLLSMAAEIMVLGECTADVSLVHGQSRYNLVVESIKLPFWYQNGSTSLRIIEWQ